MITPSRDVLVQLIGETLLMFQRFEQLLLATLLSMGYESEADAKLRAALLRDKETLGSLLRHFSLRVEMPNQFTETLDRLLLRRNLFAHRLFLEPWFDLDSDLGREQLNVYLREIRADLKVALHVIVTVQLKFDSPPLSPEAESRIACILERIASTVGRDFGGLSEEQYITNLVRTAVEGFPIKPKEA